MKKIDWFEKTFREYCKKYPKGITAKEMAHLCQLDRSTASRYLNQLVQKKVAQKIVGRPVRYIPLVSHSDQDILKLPWVEEAMAALLYPPNGLPILLTGETGVGKSYLAKQLVEIAIRKGHLPDSTPFILFNCAEYAQNPELILSQLFGVKKGAYTGAEQDKPGLIDRANQGILFLDEIHRLPPAGQEMLFTLIDQGTYRRLGETTFDRTATVRLIGATTENPRLALLPTLQRRFAVKIEIPPLAKRSKEERLKLIQHFLQKESEQMKLPLSMTEECQQRFLIYDFPGNIGQLKSDIQIACARAFLRNLYAMEKEVVIQLHDLPAHLRQIPVKQEYTFINESTKATQSSNSSMNIYDQLRRRKEDLLKQHIDGEEYYAELLNTVNAYIQQLIQTAKKQKVNQTQPNDLFQQLKKLSIETKTNLTDTQLEALAFHLQSIKKSSFSMKPSIPEAWSHLGNVSYTPFLEKIAEMMKHKWNMKLSKEELILMNLLLNYQEQGHKKRLILTVCLTGEGAAQSLKMWLKDQLPSVYQDVEIFPLEIDPFTRKSPQLSYWKEHYQLVAIVGTVPPLTNEVPYIPIWELYQPQGFKRLLQLLENDSKHTDPKELTFSNITDWIEKGLQQSVTHYNPKRFIHILNQFAPRFRAQFQWDMEREIGLWIHLGIYTDQLLKQTLENKEVPPPKKAALSKLPRQAVTLWKELLHHLQSVFLITYPPQVAYEMARLSLS